MCLPHTTHNGKLFCLFDDRAGLFPTQICFISERCWWDWPDRNDATIYFPLNRRFIQLGIIIARTDQTVVYFV